MTAPGMQVGPAQPDRAHPQQHIATHFGIRHLRHRNLTRCLQQQLLSSPSSFSSVPQVSARKRQENKADPPTCG